MQAQTMHPPRRGPFGKRRRLVLLLAAAVILSGTGVFALRDQLWRIRADAIAAIWALNNGNLVRDDEYLAKNRGQKDFAYFFTVRATPRALGDALATVAGRDNGQPLASEVDPHDYELTLTDLAGTLALATHGTSDRMLPKSWTNDFVSATTKPTRSIFNSQREDQDLANKSNLLLLLSRGYWSSEFLRTVTRAYYAHDVRAGKKAWPKAEPDDDVGYAPAPNGVYLTDGILALTAALTANPAASEWAFTDFQPGTKKIEDSDYRVGKFTHFLLFEHEFREREDGARPGMTATLTALSSAQQSASLVADTPTNQSPAAKPQQTGPEHDVAVLQSLAEKLAAESGCSPDPRTFWNCVTKAARAVWKWVQHWGHLILGLLSQTTFAGPLLTTVGVAAAASNAAWYAIEGDYDMAGLSLAAAVPGLAFGKIAKAAADMKSKTVTARSARVASESTEIAKVAAKHRVPKSVAEDLARAGAARTRKSRLPSYQRESEFQDDLAKGLRGSNKEEHLDPPCKRKCLGRRNVDIFVPKVGACIEVKIGTKASNFRHEQTEVAKDVRLRKRKVCKTVEWIFGPGKDGSVGPHNKLRALLIQKHIPYVRYEP